MSRLTKLALALAAFVALGLATASRTKAAPVIVLDRSSLGPVSTVDFQSETPNTGYGASLTFAGATFAYTGSTAGCSACGVGVVTGSNFGLSAGNNALFVNAPAGQVNVDTLTITFTSPVRSFGFDIKASNNIQTPDPLNPAQYRVTVRDANGNENSFVVNNTDFNTFSFFGFTSDVDITEVRVAMLTTGGQPVIDNVSFSAQAEETPEPATMLLFGTGIVGLASAARRRRRGLDAGESGGLAA